MMTRMTGILNRVLDEEIRVQVGPFEYQVLVPEFVRRQVQTRIGSEVTLHILEYIEGSANLSRLIPRRIGFLNEEELAFFELFCTVDKIGVRKALKALGRPIRDTADAIQRQDVRWLTSLPGIGKQSAEQIIATLKTKVTRFAIPGRAASSSEGTAPAPVQNAEVIETAYMALLSLGLSPVEARHRLDRAVASGRPCQTVEEILRAAFGKE